MDKNILCRSFLVELFGGVIMLGCFVELLVVELFAKASLWSYLVELPGRRLHPVCSVLTRFPFGRL